MHNTTSKKSQLVYLNENFTNAPLYPIARLLLECQIEFWTPSMNGFGMEVYFFAIFVRNWHCNRIFPFSSTFLKYSGISIIPQSLNDLMIDS